MQYSRVAALLVVLLHAFGEQRPGPLGPMSFQEHCAGQQGKIADHEASVRAIELKFELPFSMIHLYIGFRVQVAIFHGSCHT